MKSATLLALTLTDYKIMVLTGMLTIICLLLWATYETMKAEKRFSNMRVTCTGDLITT